MKNSYYKILHAPCCIPCEYILLKSASIATLLFVALIFVSQSLWPAYQVHRQSQVAVEVCGDGNVWRVDTQGFECKQQGASE